ncbi:LysR family transcriptional regulator [Pelagibius litoralis]|uniref:LysR family transcriptional regulator n=1 Tax=Pelagibius litoralis TaxID=374515 RepID=A0A967F0P1_9PROT|nr:LysR family transcriptional regulator [Pelagibius litoralis]NIA70912.1 LysR family transcriptional regulator [Pelagibius litoralis]
MDNPIGRNNEPHEPADDKMALLQAFAETARRLSFVKAAAALSLTPSLMSRRVKKLESLLGVQLLARTTRRVTLTEAGEVYLGYAERILADLQEADAAAASLGSRPAGLLTVSVPWVFGRLKVAPAVPEFMSWNPAIRVDLRFTDYYVDLVDQRIDVAIRIGELKDSSLRARRIADNHRGLVASARYLDRYGRPDSPDDLTAHRCLHFPNLVSGDRWLLEREGVTRLVPINPWMRANDAGALLNAACVGAGISLLSDFITAEARQSGALETVLPEWTVPVTGIYAVYPEANFVPAKTRAFVAFLVERFSGGGPSAIR